MTQSSIDRYVTSLVNGRARVRHPALVGLDDETVETLKQAAMGVEGVLDVAVNPRVGSLLVIWDPEVATVEDLKGALEFGLAMLGMDEVCEDAPEKGCACEKPCACKLTAKSLEMAVAPVAKLADVALDQAAKVVAPNVKNVRRARRITQNRLMLAAGTASVASLAFKMQWHATLGWVFVAFMAAHLYQHRRVL
ncbi:MAG: hypothetical protein Q4E62_01320 [Sutterellaceae bacterium]|nr:hypothetical protein [Sutterellaceae bacterium]